FATWGDNGLVPKEEDFEAGKDILVSVDIRNPTSEKGMAKVDLSADGTVLASRSVGLLPEETVTVQFDLVIPKEGTYTLTMGDPPQVTEIINVIKCH
ncbi:MAG: CARDB domain-containing protein, partial [Dehalococcoidia bacterium]